MTVSRHTVLIRVDRDCMHRKFMGGTEDTDSDFLIVTTTSHLVLRYATTESIMRREITHTPRLATRILVRWPEWPACFLRIVWIECTGVPGTLGVPAKMCARRGGWRAACGWVMVRVQSGGAVGGRRCFIG